MCSQVPELEERKACNDDWKHADLVCFYLETAVSITTAQSGFSHKTLSTRFKVIKLLLKKCLRAADLCPLLRDIASKITKKILRYEHVVCFSAAGFAQTLETHFPTDCFNDADLLRQKIGYVQLKNKPEIGTEKNGAPSLLDMLFNEDSNDGGFHTNGNVADFARCTFNADRGCSWLDCWWSSNACFPTIANLAINVRAIQASSVASKSTFSLADDLIDEHRKKLSDASIHSVPFLKS